MSLEAWENFFKPEVRSAGRAFVSQRKVTVQQLSDTEVQSYVRASKPFKVILKSPRIESPLVTATCTCPQSSKGQFCKHIWAALIVTADQKPDFLDGKTEIEKASSVSETLENSLSTPKITTATLAFAKPRSSSADYVEKQAAFKQKQNDYRKAQYQKQKQRLKDIKNKERGIVIDDSFPEPVEIALKYFSENGFELREEMNRAAIANAKKQLARVFHPDKGGSDEESQELNRQADILTKFAKS